jgi:hypothetical protein
MKAFTLLVVFLAGSYSVTASPLIFKATKTLESVGTVELGSFDATRFSQIRVGIIIESTQTSPSSARVAAQARYDLAEKELERARQLLESGEISRSFYDQRKAELDYARAALAETPSERFLPGSISILGVVGNDEVSIASFAAPRIGQSIVIDSPPSTVRIRVQGKGKFSVFVWGR